MVTNINLLLDKMYFMPFNYREEDGGQRERATT
jgi:hypothetical protein